MNSTTTFGRGSRKIQGLSVAAVAVIGFGILAAVGLWQATSDDSPAPPQPNVAAPAAPQAEALTPTYYYLVDSQAQANALSMAVSSDLGYVGQPPNMHVIDVSTLKGQTVFNELNADLAYAASIDPAFDLSLFQFVDLTAAGQAVPGIAPSTEFLVPDLPADHGVVTTYVYLVSSQEQALQVQFTNAASLMELADAGMPADFDTLIIDVSTREGQSMLSTISLDLANWDIYWGEAPRIEFIDLSK